MRRALTIFAVLALIALSAGAATNDTVRKSFNVGDGGTITLDADIGDIHVTSGGSGSLTIDVVRSARSAEVLKDHELTFDQSGNDVNVRSKFDRDFRGWFEWRSPLEVHYEIRVPAHYNINLKTSGGDIKAGDIGGTAEVRTSGGDIALAHVNGAVRANTSGGDVSIESASGAITARSSGGDVTIHDAASTIDAKTSGGSIEIKRVGGTVMARTSGGGIRIDDASDTIDASTSGGSIHARFSRQPRGDSRLSTSGGGVTVELASSIGAELDAHSSGGGVHSDVPVTVQGSQDDDSLRGRINGGGPRLVLRTSGGGISVRRG